MDFLKKNAERIVLFVVALALFAFSVLIILNVQKFDETFQGVRGDVTKNKTIDPVDLTFLDATLQRINSPAVWEQKRPLFNSRPYLELDGQLVDIENTDIQLNPPVPNKWFTDNELDLLDPNILAIDTDGDGFSNLDEWKGGTDPRNKAEHPPYHTKLRLLKFTSKPFRLLFAAYTGDTFQINTIDVRQPTQFLKIGDEIKGTKYKIEAFEEKFIINPSTGAKKDVSELVLLNTENNNKITLVVGVIIDDPDSFATFRYLWDGSEFNVERGEEFTLPPDEKARYKLIDINDSQAVIQQIGTEEKITVPKLETP